MAGRADLVRIDGLKETQAALAMVPEGVREVFAEMIGQHAAKIESSAREKAPMGETGDLKASIGTEIRSDGLQATVGSGVHYAPFVEFGTSRTRKRPFLYPAFRTETRLLRKRYREAGEKLKSKVKRYYRGPKK